MGLLWTPTHTHQTSLLQVTFGAGLSPVPSKLVKRTEEGEFIELSDLLPERLATTFAEEDQSKSSKSKRKHITFILEWVQCFSFYTAVISRQQPEKVPDILGYQSLIIKIHWEFQAEYWMGYGCRFRQRAAVTYMEKWANIDPTLWSLAFAAMVT